MGDRAEEAERLSRYIRAANPKAKSILELGCGTGSVLKHLARTYDVSGVDLSSRMLSVAARKVPQAKLFRQDMCRFRLNRRFDAICCVFDSINHILQFSDWQTLFSHVAQHLVDDGCFIFDINTQRKLNRLIREPAWVYSFGSNLLIMKVTSAPKHRSTWNIKVFEHISGNRYLLHKENIGEASFTTPKIIDALNVHFRHVNVVDLNRKRPSPQSERLYFICKR
jgi:cyclopropane fatty-acyl-phospholipid synthase-like methyltransferase